MRIRREHGLPQARRGQQGVVAARQAAEKLALKQYDAEGLK
jgi:hypothetical protein